MLAVGDKVERAKRMLELPRVGVIVDKCRSMFLNRELLFVVRWSNGEEVLKSETDFRKITDEEYVALLLGGEEQWK